MFACLKKTTQVHTGSLNIVHKHFSQKDFSQMTVTMFFLYNILYFKIQICKLSYTYGFI